MLERQTTAGLEKLTDEEDVEYAIYTKKPPILGVIHFRERKSASQATRALWKVTKFTTYADCSVSRLKGKMEIEYCRKDGPESFVEIGEIHYMKNQPISLLTEKFKSTVNEGVTSLANVRKQHPYIFKKYPEFAKEYLIKMLGKEGYYDLLKPTGETFFQEHLPPKTEKFSESVKTHMKGYYEKLKE